MRFAKYAITLLAISAIVLVVGVLALHSPPLKRDAPRDLPWALPDFREAQTEWRIGEDGRIYTQVQHFELRDITPEMVSWFYRVLPISTVEFSGRTMPLYHIFHPTEHGTIRIASPAPSGVEGMTAGAVIERMEWFGDFDSQGRARIVEFSSAGMLAIPEVAGIPIGEVRHSLSATPAGTAYRVDSIIGSELPLLGPLINIYIRNVVFHPAMLDQWRRHQVEEVASLQFFLREIYEQRGGDYHFVLESH